MPPYVSEHVAVSFINTRTQETTLKPFEEDSPYLRYFALFVVVATFCPSKSAIAIIGTPRLANLETNVCRRVWAEAFEMSALTIAAFTCFEAQ